MQYVYQHVPKCGGTSFRMQLRNWLGADEIIEIFDDRSVALLEHSAFETATLLCGHLSTPVIRESFSPERVLTCLRNPVDRVVSAYFYWRTSFADDLHNFDSRYYHVVDLGLDPWADLLRCLSAQELPAHAELNNLQTWQLGHYAFHRDIPDGDALERAKQWLDHVGCLGLSEEYSRFLTKSKSLLGISGQEQDEKPIYQNVTADRPRGGAVPPSVKREILAANQLDMELYEFAKSVMSRNETCRRPTGGAAVYPIRLTHSDIRHILEEANETIDNLCKDPSFTALNIYRGAMFYKFLVAMALLQSTERETGRLCEIRPRSGANLAVLAQAIGGRFELCCADFTDGGRRIAKGERVHDGFSLAMERYISPLELVVWQNVEELLQNESGDRKAKFDLVVTSLHFTSWHVKEELDRVDGMLSESGMIVVDDAFNTDWPHITAGLINFLIHSARIVPLCQFGTCVVLVRKERAATWFLKAEALLRNLVGLNCARSELCGCRIIRVIT